MGVFSPVRVSPNVETQNLFPQRLVEMMGLVQNLVKVVEGFPAPSVLKGMYSLAVPKRNESSMVAHVIPIVIMLHGQNQLNQKEKLLRLKERRNKNLMTRI